jgi:hypothetical protein
MNLADHLEENVELQGIAYDAHAGAIVEVDGVTVYLEGVERWPRGAYGVATTVTGRLTRRSLTPEPVTGPVPSHGIKGQVFVLVDPVCDLLV